MTVRDDSRDCGLSREDGLVADTIYSFCSSFCSLAGGDAICASAQFVSSLCRALLCAIPHGRQ